MILREPIQNFELFNEIDVTSYYTVNSHGEAKILNEVDGLGLWGRGSNGHGHGGSGCSGGGCGGCGGGGGD